jgi:hypothetical protein
MYALPLSLKFYWTVCCDEYFLAFAGFSPPFLLNILGLALFFMLLRNVAVTINEMESAVNEQNQGVWDVFWSFFGHHLFMLAKQ